MWPGLTARRIKLGDRIPTSSTGPDEQRQNCDPATDGSPLSAHNGRQPAVAERRASLAVIGVEDRNPISDEKKAGDQHPVALPVSPSQHPQSSVAGPAPGPRTSPGKKVLLGSLVAAVVGAGVFFGHGLGKLGIRRRSRTSRNGFRPLETGPSTGAGSARGPIHNDKTADDDPEVVVRTFPQSPPASPDGAAQQDVKAIFFDGDSATVSNRYDITLQRIAEILSSSPQLTRSLKGTRTTQVRNLQSGTLRTSGDSGKRCAR